MQATAPDEGSSNSAQRIPKIVHQLWKDESIPEKWHASAASVKRYHKGWEYRLWTDAAMLQHVEVHHPELFGTFRSMERQIMRVDFFRYILMHDFGGLYCDLDYEFLRPYDYGEASVVLSLEYDEAYGDDVDQVANYIMASVPGHPLWKDIMEDVRLTPPRAPTPADVCTVTGPGLITRVFLANRAVYDGIRLTAQPVLSPRRVHGRYERKFYINSGVTFGFHHGWGSWRTRLSLKYLRSRLAKIYRRFAGAGRMLQAR